MSGFIVKDSTLFVKEYSGFWEAKQLPFFICNVTRPFTLQNRIGRAAEQQAGYISRKEEIILNVKNIANSDSLADHILVIYKEQNGKALQIEFTETDLLNLMDAMHYQINGIVEGHEIDSSCLNKIKDYSLASRIKLLEKLSTVASGLTGLKYNITEDEDI